MQPGIYHHAFVEDFCISLFYSTCTLNWIQTSFSPFYLAKFLWIFVPLYIILIKTTPSFMLHFTDLWQVQIYLKYLNSSGIVNVMSMELLHEQFDTFGFFLILVVYVQRWMTSITMRFCLWSRRQSICITVFDGTGKFVFTELNSLLLISLYALNKGKLFGTPTKWWIWVQNLSDLTSSWKLVFKRLNKTVVTGFMMRIRGKS